MWEIQVLISARSLGKHLRHTNSHSSLRGADRAEASKRRSKTIPGNTHITAANLATDWRWCISASQAVWKEWHPQTTEACLLKWMTIRKNKRCISSGLFHAAGPLPEFMSNTSDRQPGMWRSGETRVLKPQSNCQVKEWLQQVASFSPLLCWEPLAPRARILKPPTQI